jgi:N-acetylglucosaminyl-diphospho-decaprenol L-rhamnosyltransferase
VLHAWNGDGEASQKARRRRAASRSGGVDDGLGATIGRCYPRLLSAGAGTGRPDAATSSSEEQNHRVTAARVDLVVVHRGEPDRAVETVARFVSQPVPLRVVVVDNGSSVDDRRRLAGGLPAGVPVLGLGENRGFGPAANAGFRWFLHGPGASWLAVAPHDARPAADCLPRLLAELDRRPRAGLASADVGDGFTPVVDRYIGAIPTPARVVRGWEPAGYPHGTLMLARRACLDEIGLFDERYFAYCEEADLALRARRAGWQVGVVRGAEVRNSHLSSHVAVVDYLQLRNTLLLVRDHFGRYPVTMRVLMALWQLVAGLVASDHRGPYWHPRARARALVDFVRGRFGPPPF